MYKKYYCTWCNNHNFCSCYCNKFNCCCCNLCWTFGSIAIIVCAITTARTPIATIDTWKLECLYINENSTISNLFLARVIVLTKSQPVLFLCERSFYTLAFLLHDLDTNSLAWTNYIKMTWICQCFKREPKRKQNQLNTETCKKSHLQGTKRPFLIWLF